MKRFFPSWICVLMTSILKLANFTHSVNAGTNKQHAPTRNTAKLDRETEELKHKSIDNNVARVLQQGRQAKGLSQKDLATKINEKPQIVNDYEAGR
jgi:putative transcription factor